MAKILIACEYSGRVRDAFIERGHDAISCDIEPSDSPGPHIRGDVREVLDDGWDLVVGFPPCTNTSWANGKRIHEKRADGRTQEAVNFAEIIYNSGVRAAIEHPYRSDLFYWRKPDQHFHPWQFGDPYMKWTGLWLRDLPRLEPTVHEEPEDVQYWIYVGKTAKQDRRAGVGVATSVKDKNKTFTGIAQAMADQWGGLIG